MDNQVSGIERAFQLAKSGHVSGIEELQVVLKKEGYGSRALVGSRLKKQLRELIRTGGTHRDVRGTMREFLRSALAIVTIAGSLSASSLAVAEETPLLQTLTAEQFLQLTEDFQALYVGGLIEGMAYVQYGHSMADYPTWVACVKRKTLGETTQLVTGFLKENPSFNEGVSTALAKTLSARCGVIIPKATDDSGLPQ
jgi:hypothetical protein